MDVILFVLLCVVFFTFWLLGSLLFFTGFLSYVDFDEEEEEEENSYATDIFVGIAFLTLSHVIFYLFMWPIIVIKINLPNSSWPF